MPVTTTPTAERTAPPPNGFAEVRLWISPLMRAALEAIARHRATTTWTLMDTAIKDSYSRADYLPRTAIRRQADQIDETAKPDGVEEMYCWIRPERLDEVAAFAAHFGYPKWQALGYAVMQYLRNQPFPNPDEQRILEGLAARRRVEEGQPNLDVRQEYLARALRVIVDIAERHPAETFPIPDHLGAQLAVAFDWLGGLVARHDPTATGARR